MVEQRSTQITVTGMYPPDTGKKLANVTTTEGTRYGFFPDAKFTITPGHTYDIKYDTRLWDDKEWYTIKAATMVQEQPQLNMEPPGAPTPTAQPTQGNNLGTNTVPQTDRDEHIFVTGVVGRAMGSGKFGIADIPLLTHAAIAVYEEWKEAKFIPEYNEDYPANQ